MDRKDRVTELCSGDGCDGKVMLKTDMFQSCHGDWYCNDCMFTFMCEQEVERVEVIGQWANYMVGGDDPCDYE